MWIFFVCKQLQIWWLCKPYWHQTSFMSWRYVQVEVTHTEGSLGALMNNSQFLLALSCRLSHVKGSVHYEWFLLLVGWFTNISEKSAASILGVKRIRADVLILFAVPGEGHILKCFPVCFFALLNTVFQTFNSLTLHGTDLVGVSGNTPGLYLAGVWFKSWLRRQLSCQVFGDFL